MKIIDILSKDRPTLSLEVFPPKTEDKYEVVEKAVAEIATIRPDFMSVTYGAGGDGASRYTVKIAESIREQGITPLAHLCCVSSKKETVNRTLAELKENGIENILALRGDLPKEGVTETDYLHACDLIRQIHETGDFCVGGACYPEGHPESGNLEEDILHLKEKVDAGCDFLTTQMFFDNTIYYHFLYRIREAGIRVPVLAGIMPVTDGRQMKRILDLSGSFIPERFKALLDRYGDNPEAMKQAGIVYATFQIIDLCAHGVKGIHIYTMNKPDIARGIRDSLSKIL